MPNGQNNFDHAKNMAGVLEWKDSTNRSITNLTKSILLLEERIQEMEGHIKDFEKSTQKDDDEHRGAIQELERDVKTLQDKNLVLEGILLRRR